MLVDPRIEHCEDIEDGGIMLDVVDGAGEVVQLYFIDVQAMKNFVEDVKLVLTGDLNVQPKDSSSTPRKCRVPLFHGETIH